ncbi:potassium channel family protein [Tropicibacter naphthalenivorans]|uniref:Voltage-gated potassium channel Kch n=1 Tax=Tropicibacter naphthalenivorans TaxID=441103 RepID=A0A0P1GCE2_9RHOB|nr:ion transporter [Tropicibacter naphthalenivorans]CUH79058.1 Voltage-gated potassium channel Kch [Tropicibacter naphthalenivorans]SMD03702.1 voltage-gated potassium channel [Tropicibacter naphthalenivorans]
MKNRIRELYAGDSDTAHKFRYALLIFDVVTILFVIATSFSHHGPVVETIDAVFGVFILADFAARIWISTNRMRLFTRLTTLADLIALISFLAPLAGEGLGFLRVLRTLRLLHTYQLSERLKEDFPYFRRNQDVVVATLNLFVFIFVMTGVIYATQYPLNPQIQNYADALYFTVTALTTTGFGDITLPGTVGRMISVVVMIAGVTLFLRLVTVLFRPSKVRCECRTCGLILHDIDAVHCKHCGSQMHIQTEGVT